MKQLFHLLVLISIAILLSGCSQSQMGRNQIWHIDTLDVYNFKGQLDYHRVVAELINKNCTDTSHSCLQFDNGGLLIAIYNLLDSDKKIRSISFILDNTPPIYIDDFYEEMQDDKSLSVFRITTSKESSILFEQLKNAHTIKIELNNNSNILIIDFETANTLLDINGNKPLGRI